MVRCIVAEIKSIDVYEHDPVISTIYFGGGTPSLLGIGEIKLALQSIHEKFKVEADAEITLEVNPDDTAPGRLEEWLMAGINRLSIGIQTFVDEELRWMNRAHDSTRAILCLEEINRSGFKNYSADLIYGSPFLSMDQLKKNVDIMLRYNVPHLSCYALTVEKKTLLSYQIEHAKSPPVNDQHQSEQFLWLMKNLPLAGYEHYEISNFALPGYRSRHNSSYWNRSAYYGVGPSAHSFDGINKRRWNVANNALYIKSIRSSIPAFEEEVLTQTQQLNEFIMISLRKKEGLDLKKVSQNFGEDQKEFLVKSAGKYLNSGKLFSDGNRLALTNEGKLYADGIAADLFI